MTQGMTEGKDGEDSSQVTVTRIWKFSVSLSLYLRESQTERQTRAITRIPSLFPISLTLVCLSVWLIFPVNKGIETGRHLIRKKEGALRRED